MPCSFSCRLSHFPSKSTISGRTSIATSGSGSTPTWGARLPCAHWTGPLTWGMGHAANRAPLAVTQSSYGCTTEITPRRGQNQPEPLDGRFSGSNVAHIPVLILCLYQPIHLFSHLCELGSLIGKINQGGKIKDWKSWSSKNKKKYTPKIKTGDLTGTEDGEYPSWSLD